MKLKIGNIPVKDVFLGSQDSFENGVLTINKQAAVDYLMELDDHNVGQLGDLCARNVQ